MPNEPYIYILNSHQGVDFYIKKIIIIREREREREREKMATNNLQQKKKGVNTLLVPTFWVIS